MQSLPQRPTALDSDTWREKFNADLKELEIKPKPKRSLQGLSDKELLEKYEARDFRQRMTELL